MKHYISQLLGLVFLGIFFSSLATYAGPTPRISLQDCLNRLNTHSIQIAQSMVNEMRARSALDEANRPRLPQLVVQGNYTQSQDIVSQATDSNKAVLRVEQGTLPFGSAWMLGNQRRAELEVAQFSVVETRFDTELLVKQLYFSILRDQDSIEKLNGIEIELNRVLNTVLPKFQMGRAPSFDLVKVKSSIYDLSRTRELTQAQLAGERTQLGQTVGIEDADFEIQKISVSKDSTPSFADSIGGNPTLQSLSKSIDASEATVSAAKASRLPSLSAAFEYGGTGQTPYNLILGWNAYAQVRLTLFDWGLISSQISQAEKVTILSRQKLEAETQKNVADLELNKALARAHLADQQRLTQLLPELKRAEVAAVERYRRAGLSILELTDSVSLLLQNLINERLAFYSYLSDLAKIERLTGTSGALK